MHKIAPPENTRGVHLVSADSGPAPSHLRRHRLISTDTISEDTRGFHLLSARTTAGIPTWQSRACCGAGTRDEMAARVCAYVKDKKVAHVLRRAVLAWCGIVLAGQGVSIDLEFCDFTQCLTGRAYLAGLGECCTSSAPTNTSVEKHEQTPRRVASVRVVAYVW
jgi:hypothetical protein